MSGSSSSTLLANLAVLDLRQPLLAKRLRWAVGSDHVVREGGGAIVLKAGVQALPLQLDGEVLLKCLRPTAVPRRVVVAGIGLGELGEAAVGLWPSAEVVVWDRDPWMVRLLLSRRSFATELRTGRLKIAMGPDLLQVSPEGAHIVEHPVLKAVYGHELRTWKESSGGPIALMCSQALFANDLSRDLRERGFAPWSIDVERVDALELEHTVNALKPALGVVVNQVVGLPEAFDALDVPLVTWEVDPAVDRLPKPTRPVPRSHLFTFRRRHAHALADAGHGSVAWTPLAAPPHRRPIEVTDADREQYGALVSFVGSSMTGRARAYGQRVVQEVRSWLHAHGRPPAEAAKLVGQVLAGQRANLDEWCVPELLEAACPGLQQWSLSTGRSGDPAVLLGELPSSERRLRTMAALAPFDVQVWGDGGWRVLRMPGVRHRGYAGHHHALTRIYQLSAINIDIGRLYQSDIVTMRVFDVLGCGGFLIAEHSEEIGDLFEVGVEVETWSTRAELVDKVRFYLAHPDEARVIAERGLQAVDDRHRVAHRVDQMLAEAGVHAGVSPASTLT